MIKKILCVIIAVLTLMSAVSVGVLSVSAEEVTEVIATNDEATKDEATVDEAELKISDQPKAPESSVDGMVIGYIGDTNTDGKINVKDATAVQKHLAKLINLGERAKLLGDADNNQKLNVRDATTIQKYIAGVEVKSYIWHLMYETGTHKHNYVETVFEVTCVKDGYTGYSCICGDEYKENVVEATGHSYTTSEVAPTCVDKGYTLNKCKNCNYSYESNKIAATGKHIYNKNNICSVCNSKKDPYDILKDYLIDNGIYDENSAEYCVLLETGYNVDTGAIVYNELDDELSICYALVIEDVVSTVEVIIVKDDPYFRSYVVYPGLFNAMSSYTTKSKWTVESDFLANLDCHYYEEWNEIPEEECMMYSILFIDTALAVYEYYEDSLPVTLYDLGFTSFTAK